MRDDAHCCTLRLISSVVRLLNLQVQRVQVVTNGLGKPYLKRMRHQGVPDRDLKDVGNRTEEVPNIPERQVVARVYAHAEVSGPGCGGRVQLKLCSHASRSVSRGVGFCVQFDTIRPDVMSKHDLLHIGVEEQTDPNTRILQSLDDRAQSFPLSAQIPSMV